MELEIALCQNFTPHRQRANTPGYAKSSMQLPECREIARDGRYLILRLCHFRRIWKMQVSTDAMLLTKKGFVMSFT